MYTVDDLIDRIEKRIQMDEEIYLLEGVDFSYSLSVIRSLFSPYILEKLPAAMTPDDEGVITMTWWPKNIVKDVIVSVSKSEPLDTCISVRREDGTRDWFDLSSGQGLPDIAIQALNLKKDQ